MNHLIYFCICVFSASLAHATDPVLLVSPMDGTAQCVNEDGPRVIVTRNGERIYQSSSYSKPLKSCSSDARRVTAVFNAARVLNKFIRFSAHDSPTNDFKVVEADFSPIRLSPIGLSVVCKQSS